jgi:hypothetical protein
MYVTIAAAGGGVSCCFSFYGPGNHQLPRGSIAIPAAPIPWGWEQIHTGGLNALHLHTALVRRKRASRWGKNSCTKT